MWSKVKKNETTRQIYRQILCFLIITTLLSALLFIWIFNGAGDSLKAVIPMMFTPGISAILTALIFKENIRSFGWRFGKIKFLIWAYLLPLLVSVIAYGLVWISTYAEFTPENVVNYRWAKMLGFTIPVPFIIGALSKMTLGFLLTALIVFGEEVGWSGYLTPKLRKVASVPLTSILVGLYWAIWHYPAIIGGFYGNGSPLWIALPGFTLVLIGASFVRTVLTEKSSSLWPGVVLHASHNIILMGMFLEMTRQTGKLNIHFIVSETGPYLGIVYIISAILFWKWQSHKHDYSI